MKPESNRAVINAATVTQWHRVLLLGLLLNINCYFLIELRAFLFGRHAHDRISEPVSFKLYLNGTHITAHAARVNLHQFQTRITA